MSKYFATGAQLQAAINELPASFKGSYVAFDAKFYQAKYMVGYTGTLSPVEHFVQVGAPSMAAPNPNFDPTFYANQYPDLKAAGLDAADLLVHYLKFGLNEGRAGNLSMSKFDAGAYLLKYPDVATYVAANVKSFENSMEYGARAHFVKFGQAEGRTPFFTPGIFTLKENVELSPEVLADIVPVTKFVTYIGFNPHAHGEGGVDNLDGNDPNGNDNNLTNETIADGGVPLYDLDENFNPVTYNNAGAPVFTGGGTTVVQKGLFSYIKDITGLDFVQLGLINVANGADGGGRLRLSNWLVWLVWWTSVQSRATPTR
jgi:hypothetical protein